MKQSLTVVVPALNEEKNLKAAVTNLVKALDFNKIDWEIILVNDGSTDGTAGIIAQLAKEQPGIKVITHDRRRGIGYSFFEGVKLSTRDAVTWHPGDGENDAGELVKYLPLLEHVDMIIPFVRNKSVRSYGRRVLSTFYLWAINISFGTMFNYTNGNVIYRRKVFDVIKPRANGFFYQTDCLINAVRAGFCFAEVPIKLQQRGHGRAKLIAFQSIFMVARDFGRLFVSIHILRTGGKVSEPRTNQ